MKLKDLIKKFLGDEPDYEAEREAMKRERSLATEECSSAWDEFRKSCEEAEKEEEEVTP